MSPTRPRRFALLRIFIGELSVRHLIAAFGVLCFGTVLRLSSLTTLGLFQDDAWVALTGRYRLHTSLQMAATTPGFIAMLHFWLPFKPQSTLWAQAIPLVAGIIAMPLVYLAARAFAFSPGWSIAAMALLACAPVPIATSGHVKSYTIDCCVGALVLLFGEFWRREQRLWALAALVATSIIGFTMSASTVVVIAAAWLILAIGARRTPKFAGRVLIRGLLVTVSISVIAAAFMAHLPSALHTYWSLQGNFIDLAHPAALFHHLSVALRGVVTGLLSPWRALPHYYVVQALFVSVLFIAGASAPRPLRIPLLAIGLAVVASAATLIPFGTGRTDEVLYPAFIIVIVAGAIRLSGWLAKSWSNAGTWLLAFAVLSVTVLAVTAITTHRGYPAVNVRGLVAAVDPHKEPGDFTEVDGFTRYPWALYEDPRARLIFAPGYGAGFTIASSRPLVFIQPAQRYEVGYAPMAWADAASMHRRVWYIETPADPARLADAFSRALVAHGFVRRQVIRATGVTAVLYVRAAR